MEPKGSLPDILWKECSDSTNFEAFKNLENLDNMSVVAVFCQSEGRGQGAHVWHSEPRKNITASLVLKECGIKASEASMISDAVAMGICDYLNTKGIKPWIKFPNDIWVGNKKICGLLIENQLKGKIIENSIIGIGLNVNQDIWPPELPNPVSMKELTGIEYDPISELEVLRKHLASRLGFINNI